MRYPDYKNARVSVHSEGLWYTVKREVGRNQGAELRNLGNGETWELSAQCRAGAESRHGADP